MYKIAKPLFLHCLTPLHAGSGSELGVVDLPIQRESHTGFPKIEGSSLKGSLRERFEQEMGDRKDKNIWYTFGPEGEDTKEGNLYAGALGFTDARLLLFPVKSMKGVFAWVTCKQVLTRLLEDLTAAKNPAPLESSQISEPLIGEAFIGRDDLIVSKSNIILEEYAFKAQKQDYVAEMANWLMESLLPENSFWQQKIGSSLVVLNNEDFRDFVTLSTEVITRTKIDNESGTVADGALFTEEYLPAESVLYSLVLAAPLFSVDKDNPHKMSGDWEGKDEKAVMKFFKDVLAEKAQNKIQLGANATLGKGLIQTTLLA